MFTLFPHTQEECVFFDYCEPKETGLADGTKLFCVDSRNAEVSVTLWRVSYRWTRGMTFILYLETSEEELGVIHSLMGALLEECFFHLG